MPIVRSPSYAAALVALAGALLAGVGCTGPDRSATTASTGTPASTAPVTGPSSDPDLVQLQPGAPGEANRTLGADATLTTEDWNHEDLAFVQMMVPHHRQALEMSDLAPERASSPTVLALAERIDAAQAPEILLMAGWLAEQGVAVPEPGDDPSLWDHAQHGHEGMEGMLTRREMATLAGARGPDFDRLYLVGMIGHHQGAIDMAGDVMRAGSDARVLELAEDVASGQAAEIARMEAMLVDLGLAGAR